MSEEALERAEALLLQAESWPAFRRRLRDNGLEMTLAPAEMDRLRESWQQWQAEGMADEALTRELRHWGDGRGYREHREGFHAVGPPVLVAEARRRGWFVRTLGSGYVVNPPEGKPVHLKGPFGGDMADPDADEDNDPA